MRRKFTQEEKETCWALWREGLGFSDIGRVLDAKPGSIFTLLRSSGGIPLYIAKRSDRHLSILEREHIAIGLAKGQSVRSIACALVRAPSTISREIRRNGGIKKYQACIADAAATVRAKRPKPYKLALNAELKFLVAEKLERKWSPEQISGWLKKQYSQRPQMWVSHETIYRSLYVRSRKLLDSALMQNLRLSRRMRQSRKHSTKGDRGTINIVDGVSIHKRSEAANNRTVAGHWEGDLISGSANSHLATLVDRKTRFTIILKLAGKDAKSVINALITAFNKIPNALKKSLTWDRGMELAKHKKLTQKTGIPVFFCDPQSPWQRGTNENTNRLIRQYYPKKTSLAELSCSDINDVMEALNDRPRKTLNYKTPKQAMKNDVALTG
jgi:IS30 family transposase